MLRASITTGRDARAPRGEMKKRLPVIVTILLIAAAFILLTQRERLSGLKWGTQKPVASPEDVIWRMSDAAREGNVQAYLDCFSGALRQNLNKTATEMGQAQFSQYLKKLNDEMTGIAVSDLEQANEQSATLKVEFVFRGKNEAQKHHFKLADGKWTIDAVDDAQRLKVLIPYGAPATN